MINFASGWTKSGPFSKIRAFFDFQKKGRVGLPLPPSYTPDMKDLQQNNGVVLLITKQHMQL